MDDLQQIILLSAELRKLTQENLDLPKIEQANQKTIALLIRFLSRFPQKNPPHEIAQALKGLCAAFTELYAHCQRRSEKLAAQMKIHSRDREGLNAYTTFSIDEEN